MAKQIQVYDPINKDSFQGDNRKPLEFDPNPNREDNIEENDMVYTFKQEVNVPKIIDNGEDKVEYDKDSIVNAEDLTSLSNTSDYMRVLEDKVVEMSPVKYTIVEQKNMLSRDYGRVMNDDVPIIDKAWVNSRFMTPGKDLDKLDNLNRFFSSSSWKITSTGLSYSMAINPRPQFTRYADIKGFDRGMIKSGASVWNEVTLQKSVRLGMGRYYSEAIDDNVEQIFLRFGVPKFNSLLSFFTRSVDYVDSYIANHGRLPIGYNLGVAVGVWTRFWAFPCVSMLVYLVKIPMMFFTGGPLKYYYMEPTMHTYWSTVNLIVNQMCTELGILPVKFMPDDSKEARKIGTYVNIDRSGMQELGELLPDVVSPNTGYIDVFKIIARPQTIIMKQMTKEYEQWVNKEKGDKEPTTADLLGYVKKGGETHGVNAITGKITDSLDYFVNFSRFLEKTSKDPDRFGKNLEEETKGNPDESNLKKNGKDKEGKYQSEPDGSIPLSEPESKWWNQLWNTTDSYLRDGMEYAIFNVDYTGSMSDSVNNSLTSLSVGEGIKETAKTARMAKFNLAGGNLVGETLADIGRAAMNVAAGVLDGVTFGLSNVINTIMGGGYVSLPKVWEDSDIQLATTTYTMDLISPYGNPFSQLQNIYIPLAMIMAGSFPLKAGETSYTSPFLCSVFNKGKQITNLGMITSVTIERGTGNLGYTRNKKPLGFKVSFTITDLSPTVTAPVSQSVFQQFFNLSFHQENDFGSYLGVLCSRDLYSNTYAYPKLVRKASNMLMSLSQAASPNSMGAMVGGILYPFMSPFTRARYVDPSQSNSGENKGT